MNALFWGMHDGEYAACPSGRCHISFVKERGTTPLQKDIPPRLFLSGGIRNNVWRTFSTRDYAMAVCNLTGNKNYPATLCYVTRRDGVH